MIMNIKLNKNLKAVLVKADASKQATNMSDSKELVSSWHIIAAYKGELCEAVTVRCYMGRSREASVMYASVWIRCTDGTWHSGRGSAGGYGYCKQSSAIGKAFVNAGVDLYGSPYGRYSGEPVDMKKRFWMDGTGTSSMGEILGAIARAAGYRGSMTLVSN
jgi:hypothetical protein